MPDSDAKYRRRIEFAQLVAYLLIIGVVFYTWSGFEHRDKDICRAAQVNRDSTRDLVIAIHRLGEELVVGSSNPTEPTEQQKATLARFEEFKNQQLRLLDKEVCSG